MKEKISITLNKNLVDIIENIASKQGINRSKFIENILLEKLATIPVLILAGWSEIGGTPKSLIKYNKKRLIVRQIELLKAQGLNNIYVSVSSEELKDYIESNFAKVKVIFEKKKIGSGGTLKKFAKLVETKFLFFYCDVLFELDLRKLMEFHIQEKANLSMVLKTVNNPSKYGTATIEGNKIIAFEEKPKNTDVFLIYTGIGVMEPDVAMNLNDEGKFEFQMSKINGKFSYIYEGFWKSFETEEDL